MIMCILADGDSQDVWPHRLLRALEGKTVDFYSFARDTPKGKPMECHILLAHAREVVLPAKSGAPGACCCRM